MTFMQTVIDESTFPSDRKQKPESDGYKLLLEATQGRRSSLDHLKLIEKLVQLADYYITIFGAGILHGQEQKFCHFLSGGFYFPLRFRTILTKESLLHSAICVTLLLTMSHSSSHRVK